jgi:hypothetical protein
MHFFNSFPLETDFFFCNFRMELRVNNRKKSDDLGNTVSVATLIDGAFSYSVDESFYGVRVSRLPKRYI